MNLFKEFFSRLCPKGRELDGFIQGGIVLRPFTGEETINPDESVIKVSDYRSTSGTTITINTLDDPELNSIVENMIRERLERGDL